MHQKAFGGRAPPEPAGELAYSAPPDSLAGFRGMGRIMGRKGGMGGKRGGGWKRKIRREKGKRKGKGREGRRMEVSPPQQFSKVGAYIY